MHESILRFWGYLMSTCLISGQWEGILMWVYVSSDFHFSSRENSLKKQKHEKWLLIQIKFTKYREVCNCKWKNTLHDQKAAILIEKPKRHWAKCLWTSCWITQYYHMCIMNTISICLLFIPWWLWYHDIPTENKAQKCSLLKLDLK